MKSLYVHGTYWYRTESAIEQQPTTNCMKSLGPSQEDVQFRNEQQPTTNCMKSLGPSQEDVQFRNELRRKIKRNQLHVDKWPLKWFSRAHNALTLLFGMIRYDIVIVELNVPLDTV